MTTENDQKCPEGNTKTSGQKQKDSRSRAFAFTFYPPGETGKQDMKIKPKWDENLMKWLVFAPEKCPKSDRMHYQSFVYFYDKKSFKQVAKYFGNSHTEQMHEMATYQDNRSYIVGPYNKDNKSKPFNPDFEEFGTMPSQGARTDLDELKNEIMAGKSVDEICIDRPMMYHQYGRTLERIEAIRLRKLFRTEMTKGFWYWGKSGVGKSHKVFEDFNPDTHYVKNLNEDWWDGYKGQPIVILNEFRGQIRFSDLLKYCDKYPETVKWRGRECVPFLAKEIRIACVMRPEECYRNTVEDEPWEQFYRRFNIVQ